MTRQETFTEPDDIDAPYECSWETRTLNPRKIHEKKGRQCFAKTSQKIFVASVVISMCVCYMYNMDNIQRWLKSKHYWIDVALLWALPTRLISVCTHGYTYDCKTFFPHFWKIILKLLTFNQCFELWIWIWTEQSSWQDFLSTMQIHYVQKIISCNQKKHIYSLQSTQKPTMDVH